MGNLAERSVEHHLPLAEPAWFGHFGSCGQRIETYFADYMCLEGGIVTLWLKSGGHQREDTLVACYSLANGYSVRRLLKSQLPQAVSL